MRSSALFAVAVVVISALGPGVAMAQSEGGDGCSFPVTRTDATGTDVEVTSDPERVVTLNPSAAQTMWEIGAKDEVVGVSQYASYLDGAEEKTDVSAGFGVSNEAVVGLNPDLVLAPNITSKATIGTLRNAGLTVYHFERAESLADVKAKTQLIGRLAGECVGAAETVQWMEDRLALVEERVSGREKPDVLYYYFNFTEGTDTFAHSIVEHAGGNNVAADAGITGSQLISEEVVVQQDPDWILLNSDDSGLPTRAAYQGTTAAQQNQTLVLDANLISQPAPRNVYVVEEIATALHPDEGVSPDIPQSMIGEAQSDDEETATATPIATATQTATETATQTATETATQTATETATRTTTEQPTSTVAPTGTASATPRTTTATEETPSPTGTATEPPTAAATATQTVAVTAPDTTEAPGTTGASNPGFGFLVAVIGVLGMVAVRRL